jgi:hypothetical protein
VVEFATAGSATFFIAAGVGLAATGYQALTSIDQYLALDKAAKANVKDETALVDKAQVAAAGERAIQDAAQFLLMAATVGAKAASMIGKKGPGEGEGGGRGGGGGGKRELINKTTPDKYLVIDSANPRFQAEGHLEGEGELSITLRAELEDGTRTPLFNGPEQYQAIVKHFGGQVKGVRGAWSYGTNLEQFNSATAGGLSAEDAALRTFSGTQATQAGFGRVTVRNLEGASGAYTKVDVLFHP